MLFNSVEFAVFFPTVTLLFFLTPERARWVVLLAASAVFYMAFIPVYLLVLIGLILIDYCAGLWLQKAQGRRRDALLATSIVANVGVLAVFKYYNFAAGNINELAHTLRMEYAAPLLHLALPIGLSFHTFQSMAYTIEVYRGTVPAERHLGIYALYVLFYPQLVAGPIERPQHLLPQFRRAHPLDDARVVSGLKLMAWGLFKKVVIADRLARLVNTVYGEPSAYSTGVLWLATFFFAWQIYCDFSGYTDIARGAAEVMGYDLVVNFRRPYVANSVRDFWKRWHISLSTWFRDYVYIPLGGSRVPVWQWIFAILVTFTVSGLWHGASWTFVAWGAMNGVYLLLSRLTAPWRDRLKAAFHVTSVPRLERAISTTVTFLFVSLAWVLFRAGTIGDAALILKRMLWSWSGVGARAIPISVGELRLSLLLIGTLVIIEHWQNSDDPRLLLVHRPAWVRWSVYYALLLVIAAFGVFNRSAFIYFQF